MGSSFFVTRREGPGETSPVTTPKATRRSLPAAEATFREQARPPRELTLNTKSIKALKTREAGILKKLSALEKQLKPMQEKLLHSTPTMLDPAIKEEFADLKGQFDDLLMEHRDIDRAKKHLSTQAPTDFKTKLLRGRVQKFLKPSKPSEVEEITTKLSSTITTLDAFVQAKSSTTKTNVLSSYWVDHMQSAIDYKNVKKTAKHLIDASYKFVAPLMEEVGTKGVQDALQARDNDIFTLVSRELIHCNPKDEPKVVSYFLKIAEECLKKGDPLTAQSILSALNRYVKLPLNAHKGKIEEIDEIDHAELAKRASILPKKYFSLVDQASFAVSALMNQEREKVAKLPRSREASGFEREERNLRASASSPRSSIRARHSPGSHIAIDELENFPEVPSRSSSRGQLSPRRGVEPESPREPQPRLHLDLPSPTARERSQLRMLPESPPARRPRAQPSSPMELRRGGKSVEKEFEMAQSESPSARRHPWRSKLAKTFTLTRPDVELQDTPKKKKDIAKHSSPQSPSHSQADLSLKEESSFLREALEDFGLEQQSEMGFLREDFPGQDVDSPSSSFERSPPFKPMELPSSRDSFSLESPSRSPSPRDETTLRRRGGRFEQQPIAPIKLRRDASTEPLKSVDLESPKSKSPKTSSQSPSPKGAKTRSWMSRLATSVGLRSNEASPPPTSPMKGKKEKNGKEKTE